MTRSPPLLPDEVVRRVVRISRLDGTGILVIAGAFALMSASVHDVTGAEVGILVAAAGAMELHGSSLLRAGESRGSRWLVSSQLFLLAIILCYVGWRLGNADIAPMRPLLTGEQRAAIANAGMTVDDFLHTVYTACYGTLALASFLYQGGLALYYFRRRAAVATSLDERDDL